MRRALQSLRLWTATVLINSMIMTIYLWHITVMVIIGSVLYLSGGFGFGLEPGTSEWWMTRPIWIGVLLVFCFRSRCCCRRSSDAVGRRCQVALQPSVRSLVLL